MRKQGVPPNPDLTLDLIRLHVQQPAFAHHFINLIEQLFLISAILRHAGGLDRIFIGWFGAKLIKAAFCCGQFWRKLFNDAEYLQLRRIELNAKIGKISVAQVFAQKARFNLLNCLARHIEAGVKRVRRRALRICGGGWCVNNLRSWGGLRLLRAGARDE